MRIANIIGTRPQYIKLAAMHLAFKNNHTILNIDTGQHYDYNMSDKFIDGFKLNIHHKTMDIVKIKNILREFSPDVVLLYGDTYSALIGAISSKDYLTAHVEGGVRSYSDKHSERVIVLALDHMCDICFVPSNCSIKNLLDEGKNKDDIYFVGDIMYDLLLQSDNTERKIKADYIYMTLHRPTSVDDKGTLQEILNQLECNTLIMFPIHPRTKKMIKEFDIRVPFNVKIIEPCSYTESLNYIRHAKCVITDSGGVQREAYYLKIPGIIVLEITPWIETIESGWNKLVGVSGIRKAIKEILGGNLPMERYWKEYYGDGTAGEKIVEILEEITK